jgi:hypothetical protein
MGIGGPSRDILAAAAARGHPTLFTGHVPAHSPGAQMIATGAAQWIRLPTHPRCTENIALARHCGATAILGHSCETPELERLARAIPRLRARLSTAAHLEV